MIAVVDPTEVRKAAAFVEALSKLEDDFGMSLNVGTLEEGDEPVTFGADGTYALARLDNASDLRLAIIGAM